MMGRALAIVTVLSTRAVAEPIAVQVVDAAGDQLYVTPGEAAGLRVGTRVAIGGQTFVVAELNAASAALVLERGGPVAAIAVGATGTATPQPKRAPRDASASFEQWPSATPPARAQKPRTVPLGGERGGSSVTVLATGFGATGQGSSRASGDVRVIAAFEQGALAADLDASARAYSNGWNRDEHVPLLVRTAQLSWRSEPAIAIGRLRHAAANIGMLDGARASTRFGNTSIAAFGGLAPDPLGGVPAAEASRFGAELAWDAPERAWQPRLSVAALGSTWEGELDERRVIAAGSLGKDRVWLDALVEAQSFPDDNPFAASTVELTTAHASVSWRDPGSHAGASVAYLRPERSLRLAAALPIGWQCVVDDAGACFGGDRWLTASVSAGVSRPGWALDAVGTAGQTYGYSRSALGPASPARNELDVSAYLRAELRRGTWRGFIAPSLVGTDFADSVAVDFGMGTVRDEVELSVSYRPEVLVESGASEGDFLSSVVGDLRWTASRDVDVAVSVLATRGDDRDLLAAITTLVWRAR